MSQSSHHPAGRSTELAAEAARLAADHSPDPLLELDEAGVVRACNRAALAALRYAPDQLIGQPFLDLLDAGSRAKGEALLAAATHGPTDIYELNQVAGDAEIVLLGYRAVPLPLSDGAAGTLLVGHLLSTTVATTERLIGLNRRLNALFAVAAVASRSLALADMLGEALALALAELDAQAGAVLLSDTPFEEQLVMGLPRTGGAPALYLAAQQGFDLASLDRIVEMLAALPVRFTHREPFVIDGRAEQVGLEAADLFVPAGPLISLLAVPLRSENQLLGWLYAASDRFRAFEGSALDLARSIGDLLGPPVANARLHGALLETGSQLGAVLDTIDSGVLMNDREGIVRYANARLGALLSVDVAGWPGHPCDELLGALLTPIRREGALFDGELWGVKGTSRVLRRFSDTIGGASSASGTIEVYTDVTTIAEIDRLKDEFVAAAAHDLKTPVTAVKGYTQIALRLARRAGDPKMLQQLEMINARSDELAYMMESLLDMSRIQAGRLRLDIQRLDLKQLVARGARYFEFDLQRQKRSLTFDLPDEAIDVVWDGPRIERMLINLIGNALKYSPEAREVNVRVRRLAGATPAQDVIELAFTDHGIGIAPEDRTRIFERFFRIPQVIADGFKGSGLGLYICYSVVSVHGGRIWAADAIHGGPGTTMFVVLPRYATPPADDPWGDS